jgi:protein involved in sex pheromone biosynthesis
MSAGLHASGYRRYGRRARRSRPMDSLVFERMRREKGLKKQCQQIAIYEQQDHKTFDAAKEFH